MNGNQNLSGGPWQELAESTIVLARTDSAQARAKFFECLRAVRHSEKPLMHAAGIHETFQPTRDLLKKYPLTSKVTVIYDGLVDFILKPVDSSLLRQLARSQSSYYATLLGLLLHKGDDPLRWAKIAYESATRAALHVDGSTFPHGQQTPQEREAWRKDPRNPINDQINNVTGAQGIYDAMTLVLNVTNPLTRPLWDLRSKLVVARHQTALSEYQRATVYLLEGLGGVATPTIGVQ